MTTFKSPVSNSDFNTLLLSGDHDLFEQMADYLSQHDRERTLKCLDDITEVQPIELWLGKCDILICDLRSDCSLLETASILIESAPIQLMAIGLCNGSKAHERVFSSDEGARLTDIVSIQDEWKGTWRHISSIRSSWNNPLMVSKIEDVPVSDILQMISIGRWNSMVQIQGRTSISKELTTRNAERIRGSIFFWNGEPLAAWSSQHTGVQAICDLLSLKQGILKVIRPLKAPPFRNIRTDMQDILISYAVTLDESFKQPVHPPKDFEEAVEDSLRAQQRTASPPPDGPHKVNDGTIEPLRPQESPRLHSFWRRSTAVGEALITAEPRSLPLRWMKTGDLQRLALPDNQSMFLVLRAPREFLLPMLELCAREFSNNKLDDGNIPVIRLGRQGKNYLYMASLELLADCPPLNAFPCAVYAQADRVSETLQLVAPFGHPVTAVLVPDLEPSSLGRIARDNVEYIQQCLAAPLLRWDSIAKTLAIILKVLSALAPGDEP